MNKLYLYNIKHLFSDITFISIYSFLLLCPLSMPCNSFSCKLLCIYCQVYSKLCHIFVAILNIFSVLLYAQNSYHLHKISIDFYICI